jgi:hypothetical protein
VLRTAPALTVAREFEPTLAASGFCRRHIGAQSLAEIQGGEPHCECSVHHYVALRTVADHAAIFERQPIRIFEVDRLSPLVVDDVSDLHALGAQLIALFGQSSRRTRLEGKMIEAGRNAEAAVDARIVFCRHVRNPVWFQKGDKLIAPDIEKEVSKVPTFLDLYRVGDNRVESQNALVKLPGLVEACVPIVQRALRSMGKMEGDEPTLTTPAT